MAKVIEATKGKIRDLPIKKSLGEILSKAADEAGIDTVRVTSGGQAKKGSGGKRTGSTRHDEGNAADLQLERNGHVLSFENPAERPVVAKFVTAAAALGATGIGAGVGYMGVHTLHVGFGAKMVWGAGGKAVNAPEWLKKAVAAAASHKPASSPAIAAAAIRLPGRYKVVANGGLRLRSGPGVEHGIKAKLTSGTLLTVLVFQGEWAQVDLANDGVAEGFVSAAHLIPAT